MYKYLNEVSPSDDWFPYAYIDAESNKKLDETKGRLAGNEMEKEPKYYVEYLNHDPKWLKTIIIEIYKFLIDCEYINFFVQIYLKCSKDNSFTSSSRNIDNSVSASFWETGFVAIPVIYLISDNEPVFYFP